ncbi:proline-rich protein 2-like [Canis lupus familiaris]|uniref:proline-rich protein 2-like n=1 Tax=Canis lupus familiaris TaxID=9615 RepID=UPI0018F7D41C|nr:proline-rich protein 2-like [Canis lupus familiaris]
MPRIPSRPSGLAARPASAGTRAGAAGRQLRRRRDPSPGPRPRSPLPQPGRPPPPPPPPPPPRELPGSSCKITSFLPGCPRAPRSPLPAPPHAGPQTRPETPLRPPPPENVPSALCPERFSSRSLTPTRTLADPSLPLQKKNFQLQKISQGLAPEGLPFRALSPKFLSKAAPSPASTPYPPPPALPGVRPPVLPWRPWVRRPLARAGRPSGRPLRPPQPPQPPRRAPAASAPTPHLGGSGPRSRPRRGPALRSRRPAPPRAPRD